jgi:two-component system OmpR family sensor kinase
VGEARASGSGLGLAIARSIVEMHGGQIEVASKIGEGSAFTVRLPRAASVPQGQ